MATWQKTTEAYFSSAFDTLRSNRVEMFISKLGLNRDSRVLDLGSEDGSYLAKYYPWPSSVTLADIACNEKKMARGVEEFGLGGYRVIPADGPLPFKSCEFDVIWCNSAIEHVTIPRNELPFVDHETFVRRASDHQRRFAKEIERVASHYFVQTPNIHFPIEAHSLLPVVPYLSHPLRYKISQFTKKFWIKQWTSDFLLYSEERFRKDFSDALEIATENVFGMVKSLIAIR